MGHRQTRRLWRRPRMRLNHSRPPRRGNGKGQRGELHRQARKPALAAWRGLWESNLGQSEPDSMRNRRGHAGGQPGGEMVETPLEWEKPARPSFPGPRRLPGGAKSLAATRTRAVPPLSAPPEPCPDPLLQPQQQPHPPRKRRMQPRRVPRAAPSAGHQWPMRRGDDGDVDRAYAVASAPRLRPLPSCGGGRSAASSAPSASPGGGSWR